MMGDASKSYGMIFTGGTAKPGDKGDASFASMTATPLS
jgi:hypothetical protein